MKQYISTIKGILLFRESPQALTASTALMLATIFISLSLNGFLGSLLYPLSTNIARSLFEVAILLLFVQFILQFLNRKECFTQTVTTLFSVQIVLNLIALPILAAFSTDVIQANNTVNALLGLFLVLLLMYSVTVMSHILKYALSLELQKTTFISIGYHFASILIVSLMFPAQAA